MLYLTSWKIGSSFPGRAVFSEKNDASYPANSIAFCLQQAHLTAGQLDAVVFYEKPFLKFERILLSSLATYPSGWRLFREAMKEWFFSKLWIKELITSKLAIPKEKIFFVEHHLSHAASCYYPSGFTESAIVTIDGVGEWATATIGYGQKNKIAIIKEIHFPNSLGLLYSTITSFLGFEVNEGEYKVMGMSAFGKTRYVNLKGEPIVGSPADAYSTFVRSDMDILVMGQYIIEKKHRSRNLYKR